MNLLFNRTNSDTLGIIASSLCLIHCLVTPFLLIASTASSTVWKSLDLIFLVLSFFAIKRSVETTSKQGMKYALWMGWVFLAIIIINEKLHLLHIPEAMIYVCSPILVGLHFYNLKYCQCKEACCTTN